MAHLKVIGNVVIFAARLRRGSLVGRRGLGVLLIFERVALGNVVVSRVCRHLLIGE
jgi:hypothetical protein